MADVSKLAGLAAEISTKSPAIRKYAMAQAAATVAQQKEIDMLKGSGTGTRPVAIPPVPTNTAVPTISGTATQGQTLTASTGTWTDNPTSYVYQWQRGDPTGTTYVDISNANTSTYVVTITDVGSVLRVTSRASNVSGPALVAAVSSKTALVQASGGGAGLGSSLPTRLPFSTGSTNYYVNNSTGSNANTGLSTGQAWATINYALSQVSTPGSIINVADGTYTIGGTGVANSPIYIRDLNHAGTTTNPITIKATNEWGVVVTHPTDDVGAFYGAVAWNSSGYRIQGIKFAQIYGHAGSDHPGADAAFVYASQWIEFYRCQFVDIGGQIQVRGTLNDPCEDIGFWCNHHYPSGSKAVNYNSGAADYEYAAGVTCTGDYYTTRGTHMIYPGQVESGDYVNEYGVDRLVVANSLFVGKVPGCQLDLHPQCRNSFIVNNTFYGNNKAYFTRGTQNSGWSAGNGIIIGNDGNLNPNTSHDVIVKNNIFSNLIGHAVRTDGSGPMVGNIVDSNYAYQTSNGQGSQGSATRAFEYQWPTGSGPTNFTSPGGNTVGTDPKFSSPSISNSSSNFALQISSPCIGAGEAAYAPSTDFNGAARSNPPTLGAIG